MKIVWVLVGVEQEAGADFLGAPGENFQGSDCSPGPGLRVRKAPDLFIANFLCCRERMNLLRAQLPRLWEVTAVGPSLPCLGTV